MRLRHLITITFVSALFFLSAGYVLANYEDDQTAPAVIAEPAPTPEDNARFEQLAAVLNRSDTGRDLLALMEAYKVVVRFEAGRGSSFMQAANRIRLETDLAPVKAALVFAHEMHHARTFHEGSKAHRKSDSRQAYINKMLWEEAEGMAVSIQVKKELEDNGVDVAGVTLPFADDYRQAYQEAVNQAGLSASAMNDQQLEAIGMAAGVQALFDAHMRGEARTANTHESYPVYYGRHWDEVHPIWAFVTSLMSWETLIMFTST